jgi:nucleotide-binding universal stress UspA family protein
MTDERRGPVVIAYDGSDLAKGAIEEAGRQFGDGRDALVLTVWQLVNVGFVPLPGTEIDAARSDQVRQAAERTAAQGAIQAAAAGFQARIATTEAAPTWRGITDVADEHDASLIVLGSHCRSGLSSIFIGSVASAVVAHAGRPVMIVPRATSA